MKEKLFCAGLALVLAGFLLGLLTSSCIGHTFGRLLYKLGGYTSRDFDAFRNVNIGTEILSTRSVVRLLPNDGPA